MESKQVQPMEYKRHSSWKQSAIEEYENMYYKFKSIEYGNDEYSSEQKMKQDEAQLDQDRAMWEEYERDAFEFWLDQRPQTEVKIEYTYQCSSCLAQWTCDSIALNIAILTINKAFEQSMKGESNVIAARDREIAEGRYVVLRMKYQCSTCPELFNVHVKALYNRFCILKSFLVVPLSIECDNEIYELLQQEIAKERIERQNLRKKMRDVRAAIQCVQNGYCIQSREVHVYVPFNTAIPDGEYWSPGLVPLKPWQKSCLHAILGLINEARISIHIAIYIFCHTGIADALVSVKSQYPKIDIKVVMNMSTWNNAIHKQLSEAQISVRRSQGLENGIEHLKLMNVDGIRSASGSFNFTNQAARNHSEQLAVTSIVCTVNEREERFKDIWEYFNSS